MAKEFRAERLILSAQAEGLEMEMRRPFEPERLVRSIVLEWPFQGHIRDASAFPGIRPGLTEPAFHAESRQKGQRPTYHFPTSTTKIPYSPSRFEIHASRRESGDHVAQLSLPGC